MLTLAAAVCLGPPTSSAVAQTAHFGGNILTLGGGFSNPYGVAVDASGNIFVADYSNNAVKEILAAGGYTTVNTLGSGFAIPTGVAVDANGNVFVADNGSSSVKEILAVGGLIPASPTINILGGGFSNPTSVAVDSSGNVFVADKGNNAVKEILATGGYTTVNTLGGGFNTPEGVAVDAIGNVYVADHGNGAVKRILAAGGYTTVNTLGSGFSGPFGVTVDARGNVFVGDIGNNTVKEILSGGGYTGMLTLGGGFNAPGGVAVDASGNVFVAGVGNNVVQEIVSASVNYGTAPVATTTPVTIPLTFTFDTGGTGVTLAALTQGATGLDFTDAGSGTCTTNGTTHTYNAGDTCTVNATFTPKAPGMRFGAATLSNGSGTVIATAYLYGVGVGPQVTFSPATQSTLSTGYSTPLGMAMDGSGNLFVADYSHGLVKEVLAAGGYTTVNTLGSGFLQPTGVAVDGSGNVFVSESSRGDVKEILAAGGYTTVLTVASGLSSPFDVALDGSGNLFVPVSTGLVKELVAQSGYTTVLTLSSGFGANLSGLAVDSAGNVFVADYNNHAVKKITAQGGYTTVSTLGSGFSFPFSVALDANSNVYVADYGAGVKEILAAGGYTTVKTLGSGFSQPRGVVVDRSGNVYVSNNGTNTILKLGYADPPALSFASTRVGATSSDSPKTVTLVNSGNATLTFSPPPVGLNPSVTTGFTFGSSSTCPQLSAMSSPATLAVGASCTSLVSFSPLVPGANSGSLVVTDTALNAAVPGYAAQSIALSGTGTGTAPTIAFTVPGHTYGDAPFTVSATSNSTGAFSYSVVSGPATISGATVTLTGTGTVVLQAAEASDANYVIGSGNASFAVAAAAPVIAFTIPGHTFGDAAFTVSASSNSSGALSYSVVSGPATISGATLTLTGAGTVVLQASEAASGNYGAATQNASFAVAAAAPVITFSVSGHTFGDAPFAISASSNSSGAFTYSVVSGPATISGATLTLTGAGTVVLQAAEAASGNYAASTQNATFAVAGGTPIIAFTVPSHTLGDAPFTVGASSTSTGVFTYSVVSGPATISGATITLTGAGTVVLQASEAASLDYVAGTQNASFSVGAATPAITFAVPNHTFEDASFPVSASSNSTGAFSYAVVSGPATVSGAMVTLTGAGTVVLQATQAASANYLASTLTTSFTVAAATPAITFTVPGHTFGDAPFTVSASSNSSGAFTYAVGSGPATISGTTVTLTGAGTVVLQAVEAASANYSSSTQNASFAVAAAATPVIAFSVPGHTFGDAPFAVSASSNSTGAFTYSVVSGPATISGAMVTLTGAGTVVLQASQAAAANYGGGAASAAFSVAAGSPAISFAVTNHVYGDAPFPVSASSNSTGAFTYSVVSGPATMAGATVTLTGVGTVTLQASEAATGTYAGGLKSASFTVTANAPAIAFSVPGHSYGDAPFQVSASSNSMGSFVYTVVSGPATISGTAVTLTGAGTVVLQASEEASATYIAGAATATFTVSPSIALSAGTSFDPPTQSVPSGTAASFALTFSAGGGAAYPNPLLLSVSGLPPGATATFFPAIIPAGSANASVFLIVQSSGQVSRNEKSSPGTSFSPLVLALLLMPVAGGKCARKRLRHIPSLLAVLVLFAAAVTGLSGCGSVGTRSSAAAKTYTLAVTATDTITGSHAATNVTLVLQ